jgi:hypothetical protein
MASPHAAKKPMSSFHNVAPIRPIAQMPTAASATLKSSIVR